VFQVETGSARAALVPLASEAKSLLLLLLCQRRSRSPRGRPELGDRQSRAVESREESTVRRLLERRGAREERSEEEEDSLPSFKLDSILLPCHFAAQQTKRADDE
jgi:hypothetical protein